MLPFYTLNTFFLTCYFYRTFFLKMREHLAPLQSTTQSLGITLIFITGHVELGKTSFTVWRHGFRRP